MAPTQPPKKAAAFRRKSVGLKVVCSIAKDVTGSDCSTGSRRPSLAASLPPSSSPTSLTAALLSNVRLRKAVYREARAYLEQLRLRNTERDTSTGHDVVVAMRDGVHKTICCHGIILRWLECVAEEHHRNLEERITQEPAMDTADEWVDEEWIGMVGHLHALDEVLESLEQIRQERNNLSAFSSFQKSIEDIVSICRTCDPAFNELLQKCRLKLSTLGELASSVTSDVLRSRFIAQQFLMQVVDARQRLQEPDDGRDITHENLSALEQLEAAVRELVDSYPSLPLASVDSRANHEVMVPAPMSVCSDASSSRRFSTPPLSASMGQGQLSQLRSSVISSDGDANGECCGDSECSPTFRRVIHGDSTRKYGSLESQIGSDPLSASDRGPCTADGHEFVEGGCSPELAREAISQVVLNKSSLCHSPKLAALDSSDCSNSRETSEATRVEVNHSVHDFFASSDLRAIHSCSWRPTTELLCANPDQEVAKACARRSPRPSSVMSKWRADSPQSPGGWPQLPPTPTETKQVALLLSSAEATSIERIMLQRKAPAAAAAALAARIENPYQRRRKSLTPLSPCSPVLLPPIQRRRRVSLASPLK